MRALIAVAIALLLKSSPAIGEIVRCSGVVSGNAADPYDFEIRAEIVLPEPHEYNKSLTVVQGERGQFVAIVGTSTGSYGVGLIEEVITIKDQRTKATHINKKVRHQFIVTQQPGTTWSLRGFYMKGGQPIVVRADLWHASRQFSLVNMTDASHLQVFEGRCD